MAAIIRPRGRVPLAEGAPTLGVLPRTDEFEIYVGTADVRADQNAAYTLRLKDYELRDLIEAALANAPENSVLRGLALTEPKPEERNDP